MRIRLTHGGRRYSKRRTAITFTAIIAFVLAAGLIAWGCTCIRFRSAEEVLTIQTMDDYAVQGVYRYEYAPETAEEVSTVAAAPARLQIYEEGDGPAPKWYNPNEPMIAEWSANTGQVATDLQPTYNNLATVTEVTGCPDQNVTTEIVGWDNRTMELWEMDLYARIVYLEFWGTSPECCEAGADSILRLWESGYFGDTIGETLTARAENGALVYTTYGFVWGVQYDPQGLADMRRLCEERFTEGPVWIAEFFQLGGYPAWASPCYTLDGVYFSTFKN